MTRDQLVFSIVLALRLALPLIILRYPIPGILAAIAADGDRVVLHAATDLPLGNYQLYDKSLDLYYLSIAYVATLRNWRDPTALTIARVLWFYRLLGVALFALAGDRRLLFLFPAAFEFFFIAYEIIRTRWSARRLTGSDLLYLAAIAWLCKLPQEYWLHIARRGTTAWIEGTFYRAAPSVSHLWLLATAVAAGLALRSLWRAALRRLPPTDHARTFDANDHQFTSWSDHGAAAPSDAVLTPALIEKLALVTLVGMLFAEFVPGIDATTLQVTVGLFFLVLANATLSARFSPSGDHHRSPAHNVARTAAINAPILMTLTIAAHTMNASFAVASAAFFTLLTSLLIGLHDHYHPLRATAAGHR